MRRLLRSKTIDKTRKDHRCWGCSNVIAKGSAALLVTSVDEGEISNAYWCDDCNEYLNNTPSLNGEWFMYGELREEVDEFLKSKIEGEK